MKSDFVDGKWFWWWEVILILKSDFEGDNKWQRCEKESDLVDETMLQIGDSVDEKQLWCNDEKWLCWQKLISMHCRLKMVLSQKSGFLKMKMYSVHCITLLCVSI